MSEQADQSQATESEQVEQGGGEQEVPTTPSEGQAEEAGGAQGQ